ncbi:MAG: hypothetical protein WCI87_05610 [Euryarchaeota archaeon]
MKQIKLVLCIATLAVLIISICGCTTSTTSSNQGTATSVPPAYTANLAADNLASAINTLYTDKGYTVNTPFVMTKKGDTITYHGVVTDGEKSAVPYKRDMTVVLTKDRSTAWASYNAAVAAQKSKNYKEFIAGNTSGNIYWVGYLGTTFSSDPATPKVRVDMHEPMSIGLILGGASDSFEYLSNAQLDDYYQIVTNQQTIVK